LEEHGNVLKRIVGADDFILMPAKGIFALGVGHVRRKTMEIGAKSDGPAIMNTTVTVELNEEEWRVLLAMKEELTLEEICPEPWNARAKIAGV
ncbi:MAG: Lrp/AsnC family transcriptional regulator, partial [Verrucomicrobiales bacterium]